MVFYASAGAPPYEEPSTYNSGAQTSPSKWPLEVKSHNSQAEIMNLPSFTAPQVAPGSSTPSASSNSTCSTVRDSWLSFLLAVCSQKWKVSEPCSYVMAVNTLFRCLSVTLNSCMGDRCWVTTTNKGSKRIICSFLWRTCDRVMAPWLVNMADVT